MVDSDNPNMQFQIPEFAEQNHSPVSFEVPSFNSSPEVEKTPGEFVGECQNLIFELRNQQLKSDDELRPKGLKPFLYLLGTSFLQAPVIDSEGAIIERERVIFREVVGKGVSTFWLGSENESSQFPNVHQWYWSEPLKNNPDTSITVCYRLLSGEVQKLYNGHVVQMGSDELQAFIKTVQLYTDAVKAAYTSKGPDGTV